ncbi:MAG: zf-TFIIB domain-containing protein [Acidobacteria bacterium]|nr:zf-TFIIB domain-containing protein [Acidobacteriota bacterium]
MNCPACDRGLLEMVVGDITVDVCKGGCGGVWFDNFELRKFDEPHEAQGEALLDIEQDESIQVDHDKRRNCPRCETQVMMRHFFSVQQHVEVDECPSCAGMWLDYGELHQIRTQYGNDQEREKAGKEYFGEVFGKQLTAMKDASAERSEKAKKIANMFRFICPSYYIPGKQKWGAF